MTKSPGEIGEVDPESSILFLGAGFSLGSTNIANEGPPNGRRLRRHFISQLKLPTDTDYDIQVLTEEFAENDATKLRDELYRVFRLTALTDGQNAVLSKAWRRIYSTNYDDAVELYRLKKTRSRPTPSTSRSQFRISCRMALSFTYTAAFD